MVPRSRKQYARRDREDNPSSPASMRRSVSNDVHGSSHGNAAMSVDEHEPACQNQGVATRNTTKYDTEMNSDSAIKWMLL